MEITCLTEEADVFTGHVYLAAGESRTLVDAGAMPGIVEAVRNRVTDLDSIVVTHGHDDHVERLPALREAFAPTVYAASEGDRTEPLSDGMDVSIGGKTFEAVATPGHAPDHFAFVGEKAVFSGDIVVYSDGAYDDGSFGRTDIPGADRETLVESLDRLLDRLPSSVRALYPGHGPSFEGDVRAVIERARDRAARGEPKYPED